VIPKVCPICDKPFGALWPFATQECENCKIFGREAFHIQQHVHDEFTADYGYVLILVNRFIPLDLSDEEDRKVVAQTRLLYASGGHEIRDELILLDWIQDHEWMELWKFVKLSGEF
jgi:hypothetical protein